MVLYLFVGIAGLEPAISCSKAGDLTDSSISEEIKVFKYIHCWNIPTFTTFNKASPKRYS